jgi:hypothetical protein
VGLAEDNGAGEPQRSDDVASAVAGALLETSRWSSTHSSTILASPLHMLRLFTECVSVRQIARTPGQQPTLKELYETSGRNRFAEQQIVARRKVEATIALDRRVRSAAVQTPPGLAHRRPHQALAET